MIFKFLPVLTLRNRTDNFFLVFEYLLTSLILVFSYFLQLQRAEMEELRQREANLTALQAIGPRKKMKLEAADGQPGFVSLFYFFIFQKINSS